MRTTIHLMNEIWNNIDLKRPPLLTLPTTNAQFASRLHAAISRYFQSNAEQDAEFAQTAALLGRLMCRRQNSFRRMVGFRAIGKLNAALCRLLRVDLTRDLERFRGALDEMASADNSVIVELPTRQCLDYLLVRLISVHRIYERIRDCCTQAADYFAKSLRSNYFLEINTLLLAVFGKLYCLSAVLGNKCVQLYGQLLKHRASFPRNKSAAKFLPADVKLPARLELFVNPVIVENTNSTASFKDVHLELSAGLVPSPALVVKLEKKQSDLGTAVARVAKSTNAEPSAATFDISQLTSVECVQRFIVSEQQARKASPQTCLTKNILKHEWLGAQKLFERKLNAQEHKKALGVFRKFIASKI